MNTGSKNTQLHDIPQTGASATAIPFGWFPKNGPQYPVDNVKTIAKGK